MIILMGVAGSGKSTQGKLLADEYGFAWISTGEVLRLLVTGRRRLEMLQGKLLSDDEVTVIMDKVLELVESTADCVLDGYPRTTKQVDWLYEQEQAGRFTIDAVFNLVVDEDVVVKRLYSRGRPDDTEEAIKARFEAYEKEAEPMLGDFKARGIPVYDIDASRSAQAVHDAVMEKIEALKK